MTKMIPKLLDDGYNVINIDWPVDASPDTLFMGFGINKPYNVDPQLGTDADWAEFVGEAHTNGMKVIADFNPSYWWTGAPLFKQAEQDIRNFGLNNLPRDSPARWFRWQNSCGRNPLPKPPDFHSDLNEFTQDWTYSPEADACYFAVWGGPWQDGGPNNALYGGQPTADLQSPEWRAELTRILTHWVVEYKLDGFLMDAPPELLCAPADEYAALPDFAMFHEQTAELAHSVMIKPMHDLGAVVFGEMHNLQVPTIAKMFDGGRHTDMGLCAGFPVVKAFPSLLHDMVQSQDASGFEELLRMTSDVYNGWGGSYRTQAHSGGPASLVALKAASTALLSGYYVVRKGDECSSPYTSAYCANPEGNAWPGGCFGDWAGTTATAATLKALPKSRALRPGAPRQVFNLSGSSRGQYAALKTSISNGDAAIVLLNFANSTANVTIGSELSEYGVVRPQTPTDLINGGNGPRIQSGQSWTVTLPARGWAVYDVSLE